MKVFIHYTMAIAILTIYSGEVSQSIAELPFINLLASLLISYTAAYVFRRLIEKHFVTSGSYFQQPKRQFLFDFFLSIGTGLLAATIKISWFGIPFAETLSLIFGVMVYGLFIALDMSLARERIVIVGASEHNAPTTPPRRVRSMTKSFVLVAVVTAISVSVVIILVISLDMAWLTQVGTDSDSISEAVLGVTYEILFIMAVLLGHGINLIVSYSRNLRLLFKNETRVLEKVSRGDLNYLVPVVTQDEFGLSAGHINNMIEGLRHRIQMIASLKLAEEVQRNLLPSEFPKMPGLDLSGTSVYCDETGGDYYDYLLLPGGRIGIVVADACGHGIDAALFMTTARAFLICGVKDYESPAQLLNEVNRNLCKDSGTTGRFITMFLIEIDVAKRTLRWARAGHDPALLFDPVDAGFHKLGGEGSALGVDADFKTQDFTLTAFNSGTVVVIGTDGIWETRNPSGEIFGTSIIEKIIRKCHSETAATIQSVLIDTVQNFQAGAPQEDDVALMVVKLL
jgi:sigma-B regulation protein RsbU (phosphoserine phosphatase)